MLDEACSGDSAHELRDDHTGVSRWVTVSLIKDLVRGSRKPHPRAADACAQKSVWHECNGTAFKSWMNVDECGLGGTWANL